MAYKSAKKVVKKSSAKTTKKPVKSVNRASSRPEARKAHKKSRYDDYDDYDRYDRYDDRYDDYDDDEYATGENPYAPKYEEPENKFKELWYRFLDWFEERTAFDMILMGFGALIVAALVTVGVVFFTNEISSSRMNSQFAKLGKELEGVDIIGQEGINAALEKKRSTAPEEDVEIAEEEFDEEENKVVSETDANGKIAVVMNLTSIQRDLKIKFINNNTQKLISGVNFEVNITDPSGNKSSKTNSSKDGIIHLTGITPGKYQVALVGPLDEKYSFLKDPVTIDVKDVIEYKKVDISAEIKKESEVNIAAEDTAQNNTAVESTNQDTVEWVESTKTLIEGTGTEEVKYEEIEKEKIADPGKTALGFRLLSKKYEPEDENPSDGGEGNTGDNKDEEKKDETPAETPTKEPTQEPTQEPEKEEPTPTKTPTPEPTKTETPSPTSTKTASPSPSESVSASPSATPTATPNEAVEKAKKDTTSILKSTAGDELYIKDGDKYKKATYADYYKDNLKFYKAVKSTANGKYKYTGWQTIDGHTYFYDKNGNYVTGEQVIQGAKYVFDSDGRLSSSSGVLGIDVSKWNGAINWDAVKNSGINFVIIRCGFRGSATAALVEDANFRSNIKGAQAAGLKVGVYFYSQAVNEVEAVEEASMALSLVSGYNLSYPIFLDVESSGGRGDKISAAERTKVCEAFCRTVANSGYKAGVYANKTWFNSMINTSSISGYKIWLAQYAAAPTYTTTRYDMWQYSSKGSVSGISGKVDMNISYLGY